MWNNNNNKDTVRVKKVYIYTNNKDTVSEKSVYIYTDRQMGNTYIRGRWVGERKRRDRKEEIITKITKDKNCLDNTHTYTHTHNN